MCCSIFLTGATGYVGRHILSLLTRKGHRTTCLARTAETAQRLGADGHAVVVGDLSSSSGWLDAAACCDAVIHAAFPYGEAGEELADVEEAFIRGFLARPDSRRQPPKLVYTSSLFLFGAKCDCAPFSECDAPALDPAAWRIKLEQEVLQCHQGRPRHTVIRLGWVYGGDGGTLADSVAGASLDLERCEQRVPLVHVDDAARLYVQVIEQRIGGLFHACEPAMLRWREVIRVVQPHRRPQPTTRVAHSLFDRDRPAQPQRSVAYGWMPARRFASDYVPQDGTR